MANKATTFTKDQTSILKAFQGAETPMGAKEIALQTNIDQKIVSAQIKELKAMGLVDSPVRCKYAITPQGKNELD